MTKKNFDLNAALKAAVELNNIKHARKLIKEGANPKDEFLIRSAIENNNIKMIKLLVEYYQGHVGCLLENYIFKSKNSHYTKELLTYTVELHGKDEMLLEKGFFELVESLDLIKGSEGLEILQHLLDLGLPIDDCISMFDKDHEVVSNTPLQHAIKKGRDDYVFLLLDRGVNVSKRTQIGEAPLLLAIFQNNSKLVEVLLKKGADPNEPPHEDFSGPALFSTLFRIWTPVPENKKILRLLLKYGADVSTPGFDYSLNLKIPLKDASEDYIEFMVRELAKLKFGDELVYPKNLKHIQEYGNLERLFQNCLMELQRMKSTEFYNGFSVYDIYKMENKPKKLIFLTRNEDFIDGLKSCLKSESFQNYSCDLNDILTEATKKRDVLLNEEKKLFLILKDFLPALVIHKIAYFIAREHLFDS